MIDQDNNIYFRFKNSVALHIQKGIEIVDKNISSLSDAEKNKYYDQVSKLDILFTGKNLFSDLEKFYRALLKKITKEKKGWSIFKPNFLIRLGFSVINQKRYDEGLAYILQGYESNPQRIQKVLKKDKNFDSFKYEVRTEIYAKLSHFTVFNSGQPLFDDIKKFLNSFEVEEQLFLHELVTKFKLHIGINKSGDNLSSRRTLFADLNQLCILTESNLRDYIIPLISKGIISKNKNENYMLGGLLRKLKEYLDSSSKVAKWTEHLKYNYHYRGKEKSISKSPNYIEFNRNLRSTINKSQSDNNRRLAKHYLFLYCVRNFSGHHFKVKNSRSEFLFKHSKKYPSTLNIEIIFWSIFGALYNNYKVFNSSRSGAPCS